MGIPVKVGGALQRLFGEVAETAAAESDVLQRTRKFTPLSLAVSLDHVAELERVFADMRATFAKTCRRDKRSKPETSELPDNAQPLDFELP